MSNVVEVLGQDKNLVNMSRNVKAAGLDAVLSQKGPFTIFAPSDIAFGKLSTGRMPDLLKSENKDKLTEMLNHHIVEELVNISDLTDNQKLVTANGRELNVSVADGKVTINGSVVQSRDAISSNGVVHSLDTVIEFKQS
jgi:uncharacterized surface protein with fasciclin (FAS1) repeats